MTFKRQADDWLHVLAALEAEKTALQNAAGGWERRETGRLLGDVWRSMNRAEQRRYLERQCETGNWRVVLRKEGRRRSGDLFAVIDSDHWVKGLREPVGPDDDLDDMYLG
jgi:S-adenosylmethionine:diacylglycerol 3-amino-3-carboxypropyl transferase